MCRCSRTSLESILWRQKEQFSDGVGYSWIDGLKGHAEAAVSDEDFARRSERWPEEHSGYQGSLLTSGTSLTVRSYPSYPPSLLASMDESFCVGLFPSKAAAKTAVRWIPRGDWGCSADPSGRSVSIHNAAYGLPADE
jgi:asparagine synthase (glutamine-hydrolysing)